MGIQESNWTTIQNVKVVGRDSLNNDYESKTPSTKYQDSKRQIINTTKKLGYSIYEVSFMMQIQNLDVDDIQLGGMDHTIL